MDPKPLLSAQDSPNSFSELFELYPELSKENSAEWLLILERSKLIKGTPNTILATAGSMCTSFMLLLDGTVRVYQDTEDGRELTLYRINPGDVCLMSLNSLLNNKPFRANAKTESDVRMLLIETGDFHIAMGASQAFRTIMLTSLVDTVCTMVHSFYDTAFEPLEMRLIYLLGRLFERSSSETLKITHQALSQELGASRETISRILKNLEQQNFIILKRGYILLGENREFQSSLKRNILQ